MCNSMPLFVFGCIYFMFMKFGYNDFGTGNVLKEKLNVGS